MFVFVSVRVFVIETQTKSVKWRREKERGLCNRKIFIRCVLLASQIPAQEAELFGL